MKDGTRGYSVWRQVTLARRALAEGRVDDLVRHVEAAADAETSGAERASVPRDGVVPALAVASLFQAAFRFTGDAELRDRGIRICSPMADRLDRPHTAIRARATLATFHVISGRYHAMADCCDASIALAEATGLHSHAVTAMAYQFKGYALFEWNRLAEARILLERAWDVAGEDSKGVRSGTARILAAVAHALHDTDASDLWLARLESTVSEPLTLRNREWLAAVRIRHGILTKRDLRQIDAWIRRYDYPPSGDADPSDSTAASRLHEYENLLAVLEATSQWAPMLSVADSLSKGSSTTRLWFAVRALAARSVALEALGRPEEADRTWSEALALGEKEGYVRAYLEGRAIRRRLLERAQTRPGDRGLAERVLEATRLRSGPMVSLTPKQRETLEHIAEGLSNRRASLAMGVSESTVRTHLRDIYRKLGVGSRTGAVAEARRAGLI